MDAGRAWQDAPWHRGGRRSRPAGGHPGAGAPGPPSVSPKDWGTEGGSKCGAIARRAHRESSLCVLPHFPPRVRLGGNGSKNPRPRERSDPPPAALFAGWRARRVRHPAGRDSCPCGPWPECSPGHRASSRCTPSACRPRHRRKSTAMAPGGIAIAPSCSRTPRTIARALQAWPPAETISLVLCRCVASEFVDDCRIHVCVRDAKAQSR